MLKHNWSNLLTVLALRTCAPILRRKTLLDHLNGNQSQLEAPSQGDVSERTLELRREIIVLYALGLMIYVFVMMVILAIVAFSMALVIPEGSTHPTLVAYGLEGSFHLVAMFIGLIFVLLMKQTAAYFQKRRFMRMRTEDQAGYTPSRLSNPSNWDILLATPVYYLTVSLSNGWWPWV